MMKKSRVISVLILMLFIASGFAQDNKITVKPAEAKDTISRHIYGHFSEHLGHCIYGGIWVGEESSIPNTNGYRNDVVNALKELEIPNLRWPGGCFADAYHWKDGIGPKEDRPPLLNFFWGNVVEDNSFGTHEFLDLCEMLGTEPYIAVNVGSGTPKEAYDWVEYVTSEKGPMADLRRQNGREKPWNVKYWGIGNENWGCGGNMTADYYADLYKRFATYARAEYSIASGGLNHDPYWTETLMKKTEHYRHLIEGMSYHHYTVAHTWQEKGSALEFNEDEWFLTVSKNMRMEENLKMHTDVMDKYDPEKRIALVADEWGNWHDAEPGSVPGFLYQQNTLRDAITASIYLNIFNNHCDRVKMANIAQTVNVLQAMVLTKEDQLVKTPTFYVFKMYKVHKDALLLPVEVNSEYYYNKEDSIPALSVSASKNIAGETNITIANVNPNKGVNTAIVIEDGGKYKAVKSEIITSAEMNDYNDFGKDELINIQEFDDYTVKGNEVQVELPPKSVILITLANK